MKNKLIAVGIVAAVLFVVPLLMSLVWLVMGVAAAVAVWKRDELKEAMEKAKSEISDVLNGGAK